jgi:hypothetical protein
MLDADAPTWRRRSAELLAEREWAHVTHRIRALGWDFGVRTNLAPIGLHLDGVFSAMAEPGEPEHWYSFVVDERDGWTRHRLYRDGDRLLDTPDASRAVLYLLWDVNQRVFRSTNDHLLVHASAVSYEGRAVLMSAPSESGKSTLSLGLVERGLGYLTDEAAALDLASLLVQPFPKAVSVDVGAQSFLEHLRPPADPTIAPYLHGQWQVTPDAIRVGAVGGPAAPAWIVAPRYVRDAETALVPMTRAETLSLLLEQALNLHVHGRAGFDCLAEVVRRCRCFRLVMGDLPSACDTMLAMLAEGPGDD